MARKGKQDTQSAPCPRCGEEVAKGTTLTALGAPSGVVACPYCKARIQWRSGKWAWY